MLHEVRATRPFDGRFRQRWFTDEEFDLTLWLTPDGEFAGFQLCYDKGWREHALTFREGRGFTHDRVDEGGDGGHAPMSPILRGGGRFAGERVIRKLIEHAGDLDPGSLHYVVARLERVAGLSGLGMP